MHIRYTAVFQRLSVENPVENVEKSSVSVAKTYYFPFTACEKVYTEPLHKANFSLHFQNYVAIEFSLFFEENPVKSSDFRDLLRKEKGSADFAP